MQVRLLGPFQLEDGGRQITVGGVRQRAVLADLVLNANEVMPSEQLLVELWGEDSPPSAANSLQAAISRSRRVLPAGRLITTARGYMLRLFPAELDVAQFEQLIFEGRDALAAGTATDGMVTKLRATLDALTAGVSDIRIVDGREGQYATAAGTAIARSVDFEVTR